MTAVVLGNRLNRPVVSAELAGRLDVALDVRRGSEPLVLSGGDAGDAGVPEATVMREYVLDRGVDPALVHAESRALDTVGNAYFSRLLCDRRGLSDVSFVTSCYHVPRARFVFERVFGVGAVGVGGCHVADQRAGDRRGTALHEASSLSANRELFAPVADGDLDAIGRRLEEAHDLYDDVPGPTDEPDPTEAADASAPTGSTPEPTRSSEAGRDRSTPRE